MEPWAPRAIVVIHGMGMHQRGTTQRGLVEGLKRVGLARDTEVDTLRERVPFGKPLPPIPIRVRRGKEQTAADVYEIYWAPMTAQKTKARSVLGWLLKQTFLPGKALRKPSRKTLYDLTWLTGTALASLFLVLVVVFSLTDLTHQAYCHLDRDGAEESQTEVTNCADPDSQGFEEEAVRSSVTTKATLQGADQLFSASKNFWQSLWSSVVNFLPRFRGEASAKVETGPLVPTGVLNELTAVVNRMPLPFLLPLVLILWITVQLLYRLVNLGDEKWLKLASLAFQLLIPFILLAAGFPYWVALVALLVLSVVSWFPLFQRPEVSVMAVEFFLLLSLIQLAPPVLVAFVWVLALARVFFGGARRFLAEFIGDVQVYTNRDELSTHFVAREGVLAAAEQVFETVDRRGYEAVVVVGHSLGSVVALDALERLDARDSDILSRVDAIVTFGTALEKVKYFFSRESDSYSAMAVRRLKERERAIAEAGGIEDIRQSVAVAQSLQTLERAVDLAGGKRRAWVNLWYANDVVANPITSFGSDDRKAPILRWRRKASVDVDRVLLDSREELLVNAALGWRFLPPWKIFWPHSDYWTDDRVLEVIGRSALPVVELASDEAVRKAPA
jgi:pimeloyl-ACP methyl ester carboxylesterase